MWLKKLARISSLFTILWSSISLLNGWRIERGLNDFHQISYDGKRFQIPDYNDFHANSLTFLRSALEAGTPGKKVVVTHHVPTFKNYLPEYKGDYLNEAFATILDDLISDTTSPDWAFFEPFFGRNSRSERFKAVFLIPNWAEFEPFGKGLRFPFGLPKGKSYQTIAFSLLLCLVTAC